MPKGEGWGGGGGGGDIQEDASSNTWWLQFHRLVNMLLLVTLSVVNLSTTISWLRALIALLDIIERFAYIYNFYSPQAVDQDNSQFY